MLVTKLKTAAAATLLTALLVSGAGLIFRTQAAEPGTYPQTRESKPAPPKQRADPVVKREQKAKDRNEIFDDGTSSNVIFRHQLEARYYNELFDNLLDVVDDFFEVFYAQRYEGRIETSPQSLLIRPIFIRRRAIVMIRCEDSGGYLVSVHIGIDVGNETNKSDEKNPVSLGRDTAIEKAILRRVIEQDRHRQEN